VPDTEERQCPDCGASLSTMAGPEGFCPECLIQLGLAGADEDPSDPVNLASEDESQVPERIGNYRLVRRLGEGGMGTVFLAEQVQPIRRTVALKLIKAGMDTRQIVSRFESERQALALLDHPSSRPVAACWANAINARLSRSITWPKSMPSRGTGTRPSRCSARRSRTVSRTSETPRASSKGRFGEIIGVIPSSRPSSQTYPNSRRHLPVSDSRSAVTSIP